MIDLPPLPSGLQAVLADVRQFLSAVRFARPELLWLSLVPAFLSFVAFVAARRQRKALGLIGRPAAVYGLLTRPRWSNRLGRLALFLAWTLLTLGAAGPRWGRGEDEGVAVGRDVVVVLDLSRSMLADDTTAGARWRSAVAGAADLVDALRARGGHRAAIVVFAARPKLLVPLTTDYDHLQVKLADLDGVYPPAAIRPEDTSRSGTRIGAALAAAVAAHDPRFSGFQDIILISDGDDPVADREWAAGVSAARKLAIPVHVVGVGDPRQASGVVLDGEPLTFQPRPGISDLVQTRMREDVLQQIAGEGYGRYLPAEKEQPRLGDFFRGKMETDPTRELIDDALPQSRDRSVWFLGLGLVFLLLGWLRER
jgi:Ca-activated chloride channel family protein